MVLAQVVLRRVAPRGVAVRCFMAVKREASVWWSQKEWNQRKGGGEWQRKVSNKTVKTNRRYKKECIYGNVNSLEVK